MKQCSKCGISKPKSEYYKNKRGTDGLAAACKGCLTKVYAKHRLDNIEHYNAVRANAREEKSRRFQLYKQTLMCILCGENDEVCLDFHHLDPNQKDMNISSVAGNKPWDKLMEEIDKCVPLCSNCHRKVHAGKITLI